MTDRPKARPLFAVAYPYKVTDFHCELFEIDAIAPHAEVVVLDVSRLVTPEFSGRISAAAARRPEVRVIGSWKELRAQLDALRERSRHASVCIQNVVPHSLARGLFCNLLMARKLRGSAVRMFDLFISGTPVYTGDASSRPAEAAGPVRWIRSLARVARQLTTLSEAFKKLAAVLFRMLSRVLPSAMTHRLVAGTDWENLARASAPRAGRVQLVKAHSHDYSRSLLRGDLEAFRGPRGTSAVLLDAAGPMFGDDYVYMGRKSFLTAEAWYPALCAFFDRLEGRFDVRIQVAGHYKSRHPAVAPHFGNRNVFYGQTQELTRNAKFVMTRQSAAVAYAVMYRKPVIFLCSNQIEKDLRAIHGIRHLASLFGKVPVNIDEPPAELDSLLEMDEARYQAFESACLTSDPKRRPNSQIILEDIMNIPTHGFPQAANA